MLNTFPTYDHTLCNQHDCKKSQSCKRYLTYQKAIAERYKYTLSVYVPKETPKECTYYEPIKSK